MNHSKRAIASFALLLVLILGAAAFHFSGRSDASSSTFTAVLPTASESSPAAATASTSTGVPSALAVPAKSDGEISRVVLNLSPVPGKTTTLSREPEAGVTYDLRAACVGDRTSPPREATVTVTDGTADTEPTTLATITCDGSEQLVSIGGLPARPTLLALRSEGAATVRGYAVLGRH